MAGLLAKDKIVQVSVTISAGGKTSTVLDKRYFKYMAILLPSNWVTSIITLTGCDTEDGTFLEVVHADDAGAVTIASVAASKAVVLSGEIMQAVMAVPFIKLVSTTTQAATDKVIKITLKN